MTGALRRASWQALGTSVELAVDQAGALAHARALVERQLDEVDLACSRFRDDSELTRVNSSAGRIIHIGPLLAEAIDVALRAADLTGGDVDPTVGTALVLAGYDRDWQLLAHPPDVDSPPHGPSPAGTVRASVRPGWKAVELDREHSTIRLPPKVELDLGATAKAWAADRAARAVYEETGSGVLLSLGGDISTAGPAPSGGRRVHVTDDHRDTPDAPGQTISIQSGGLATSSTTVRRWRRGGRTMHHIIDPATGTPAREVWRTVSVAAANCTDANIATTAAIVRGARAPEWLDELSLPARLVACDGQVVHVGDWPRERDGLT